MAKEIATKTKLDTRIAADIAAAMPVATKPVAAKAALASEVAKKAIVIDTEEVQAAAEQVVDSSSADVIVAQAAGASSSAAAGGAAAGGMSTTALVVAGVAVAAAAGSSSSSSTPAAATPAPAPAPAPTPTGVTVALTSNATPDIISLTAGANDTVNSAAGTLAAADVITDGSQADEDVLNITLNGYVAATTPTVINVENINVIGNYATTGLALTNVNGAKALNLSAGINGATATVIDASAVKATTINAGANVGTVAVTALAAGTSGVVTTNAGTATTVTITGGAGADQMTTNLAAASTFTLDGAGGTDTFVVNLGGGANTMTIGTTQTIENFTLNTGGSAANTITLGNANILVGNAATNAMVVGGTQALTITGDLDAVVNTTRTTGIALTKAAGAGALQFTSNAAMAAAGGFMNEALFDTIRLGTVAIGNNLTINENSTLQLAFNQGTITFDVDNNTTTAIAAGGGTLKLDLAGATVAANTTDSLTTGVGVGTTIITNNGAAAGTLTVLNTAATATSVDTVVVSGTKDLTVGTWTATANELFNATGLSGSLTLTIGANAATVIGGSGNDLLTGGAAADLIRGGAGNDRINGGGATVDTLTGGDGVDTFIMNGAGIDVITDFTTSDVIGLSVAAVGSAMVDGNAAASAAGNLARVVHVSAATTLAAGQNVIVLDGTFANAAAVETAIEAAGTRQLTFATAPAQNDDFVIVWTNGTNAFVSTYNDGVGGATTMGAAGTLTNLLQLSGVASVDNFSSNNFIVLA